MRIPDSLLWYEPKLGFPSLTVSYDKPTNYFFNGHIASMTFIWIYFLRSDGNSSTIDIYLKGLYIFIYYM